MWILQGLSLYFKCVATLPCEIQKSNIAAELLLISSKVNSFTSSLTKRNDM